MGKSIAADFINILEDGTIENNRGSINIDDEGNDVKKVCLVKDGKLESYIHDRISADFYGVEPTGNGRRQSFRYVPIPRMRTTYMEPGPHSREDIISQVDYGVYVDNFSNGQVNIGAGDFKMDNGTWTCGKGGQSVPVTMGLPTVLVKKLTVGGTSA